MEKEDGEQKHGDRLGGGVCVEEKPGTTSARLTDAFQEGQSSLSNRPGCRKKREEKNELAYLFSLL